ncbi:hypothetical protein BH09PSE3_BH09PSE3_24060 [soil metagenome]
MTTISKIARIAAPLAFAALLGLAACSKQPDSSEQENLTENQSIDEIPPEAAPPAPEIVNETVPENVAVAAPPKAVTEDQQVQEDADASGMTSHLAPEEQAGTPAASEAVK